MLLPQPIFLYVKGRRFALTKDATLATNSILFKLHTIFMRIHNPKVVGSLFIRDAAPATNFIFHTSYYLNFIQYSHELTPRKS